MQSSNLKKYGSFVVTRIIELPEIQATLTELRHEKLGSEVIHIACDDDENLFSLSFRTIPKTSNGVAHILEHTVLCGSKKFPVKDPFFSMNRRSLNTFMNAFTGADFTSYPASSQVKQDFYNLLSVYLDAVFYPKLTRLSFLQEGHRFEFSNKEDISSPLTIQGVVYNEMKGALSSPDARLNESVMSALFPTLTYGINSGGDPKVIPSLTHEELKAFHSYFYHPSHCVFFFYGNLALEEELAFVEKNALQGFSPLPPLPPLPKEKRFEKKVKVNATYPATAALEEADKTMVSLAWLTSSILDQEEILALSVLDLVLMGTDASPLKHALLKSNLCASSDSDLEDEMSEVPYILTCKGCNKNSAEKIEKVVFDTLEVLAKKGLPLDMVEGAIHQLEFSRTEISVPFGLALFFRACLLKQQGGHPEDALKMHTLFKALRERVQDPLFFPSLIRKYFLDNTHYACIVMQPDKELSKKESKEEQELINKWLTKAPQNEKTKIVEESLALERYQEMVEDLECLPKVTLKDVPRVGKEFDLKKETFGPITCFHLNTFTNEIVYVDLVFDLPEVQEQDLHLVRLLSLILPQIGCGGRTYKENLDYLFKHTGGVNIDCDLFFQTEDENKIRPALIVRGKALYRKTDKLFPLFADIITTADFSDTERLSELLKDHFEELENNIQSSPLRYALQLSSSGLSTPLKVRNQWFGLDYYYNIKKEIELFNKTPLEFVKKLEKMYYTLFPLEGCELVLSCDEKMYQEIKKNRFFGLEKVPYKDFTPWKGNYKKSAVKSQGRISASSVAFTSLAFPTFPYVHPSSAFLNIASKIMENKTLHKRIREQGGAYGSGSANVPMSGHFYFYSYRDPNIASTKAAFFEAIEEIAKGNFDARELEEAKLGILQDLDAPIAPGNRSYVAYERLRCNRTKEIRQKYRDHLLDATIDDIKRSAKEILLPKISKAIMVSFANKELLEKENALLKEEALPILSI